MDDKDKDHLFFLLESILKLQLIQLEGEQLPTQDYETINWIQEHLNA